MKRVLNHWQIGGLMGVLVLVLVGGILIFGALFAHDHGRGPIPTVMLSGNSTNGAAVAPPMMGKAMPSSMVKALPASDTASFNMESQNADARRTVTNAALDLRVENIDSTVGKISEITLGKGGYVATLERNQPKEGTHTAWMLIKIPKKDFFPTYEEVKNSVYYVESESLSGEDVTQQGQNLDIELKNRQDEEATLQGLLKKATNVQDTIQITDRLNQVRSEIESIQAQERNLSNQTDMSAVSISMVEDPQIRADAGGFRAGNVWKQAVNELRQALVRIGAGLVIVLVTGIPIILVYALILWIVYFFTKKGVKRFFDR